MTLTLTSPAFADHAFVPIQYTCDGDNISPPLKWSDVLITFSRTDHPKSTKGVGRLPIVVTPTIHNIKVGRVLIDGGAGSIF